MREFFGTILAAFGEVIGQLSMFYGFCCRTFRIKPHHEVYSIQRRRAQSGE